MGYHIIKNDGTYRHWVAELEYSGIWDPETHFCIETESNLEEDVLFKTYNKETKSIVVDQDLLDEVKSVEVRNIRNSLLSETDFWATADYPITQEQSDYRKALRDITSQEGFPHNVIWPIKP